MKTSETASRPVPPRPATPPGTVARSTPGAERPPIIDRPALYSRPPLPDKPARPSLQDKAAAPVIVKLPAPFFVRASQVAWFLSLLAGAAAIVYLFVIRQTQLPLIADMARAVDATRAEATYTSAADIIFWSVFALAVTVVFLQIVFQVSFSNRRPHARWWQFGSILFQAGLVLIARQMIAVGERGVLLDQILLIQLGLAVFGLLLSLLPQALRWTARQHDIRRGPVAPVGAAQL